MKISEVIVVEGKNDVAAVKRAVDAFVVTTSGSGITKEMLEMFKKLHEERGIIILTDPDTPGEKIRSIITEQIPTAHHAFIKKKDALVDGDVGIENASPEAIRESLKGIITYNEDSSDLNFDDLVEVGLIGYDNSKELREKLCDTLSLTYSNGKTLLKRLRLLNVSKDSLMIMMEALDE